MKPVFFKSGLCLAVLLCGTWAHAQDGAIEDLRRTGKAFASVAQAVSPAVVFVRTETTGSPSARSSREGGAPDEEFFRRFFGQPFGPSPRSEPNQRQVVGQGSGFVFSARDGFLADKSYILTNNHVVENADRILVQFQDGAEYEAKVTGRDPQSDVAVIEIPVADLATARLGDSDALEVGEWVVAIGNPFGLSHTLTVGVVSATGRTGMGITDYEDFIQTDAAINPGNSGGPLVNLDGQVIGINSAIFSRSGGYMGVGFAIPINLAKNIAHQLIENGEVVRGFLGITIQPLTPDLAESFGLEVRQGIVVSEVMKDSPAENAGIQSGDVIIKLDGDTVRDPGSFRNHVAQTPQGDSVSLTVIRDGKQKVIKAKVGKLDDQTVATATGSQRMDDIGLNVQNLTAELAEQFGAEPGKGVLVTDVRSGSVAEQAGLEPGTIILQANGRRLQNAQEFAEVVAASREQKRLVLLVRQRGSQRFVALSW